MNSIFDMKTASYKQVFFSLEFVNILLQKEANPVKNASSLLLLSGHSELETGLLSLDCKTVSSVSSLVIGRYGVT